MNFKNIFQSSNKPHILMITNHGIHQWQIIPGLPDTGGQNVFVNQFTQTLAKLGYKITIINRGGYKHPTTGEEQIGVHYKDENQRIVYLNDHERQFIRKEDMNNQISVLSQALIDFIDDENIEINYIISHYWDGAKLGVLYNLSREKKIKHIWVPHSLGAVKKRNVDSEKWEQLRIDERIETEKELIQELDFIAATSATIRESLVEDYKYKNEQLFLPPCINPERYYPREIKENDQIWDFLNHHFETRIENIQKRTFITEISRTDTTKRKDILIKAFARVNKKYPDTLLLVTIDVNNKSLSNELDQLIKKLKLEEKVIKLGSIWDKLPTIYAITDIYCTPSIMEGFGMTPQEAAATKKPIISSDLVPFVTEYLLGEKIQKLKIDNNNDQEIILGEGAIIVPADNIDGFGLAIEHLLENPELMKQMADKAYQITIPYFTWENMVEQVLSIIKK